MRNILNVLTLLLLSVGYAHAAEEKFLQTAMDIPLMEGTEELPEEAVIFDKPEGRFVETLVALKDENETKTQSFYQRTMPQLGWTMIRENLFSREGETLQMSFETHEGAKYLKFVIAPAATAAAPKNN